MQYPSYYDVSNSYYYCPPQWGGFSTDRIIIPCGHCSFCLKNRRDEWTIRLLEEFKDSLECIFLTLTYPDESVHYDGNVHKEHLQKFWKRLRKDLELDKSVIMQLANMELKPIDRIIMLLLAVSTLVFMIFLLPLLS